MRQGLRENLGQFSLLVLVNAFVGAMVGLERAILPLVAEQRFGLTATTAVFAFIVAFGLSKAGANYVAGRLAGSGRRRVLLAGWIAALPVPVMLAVAPSWGWVIAANVLLGLSQGLAWSATVIMKIDLAGPRQRGLAMGLNEFAGYLAVGGSALASGYLAARFGLGPGPFVLGIAYAVLGLALSVFVVRETAGIAALEETSAAPTEPARGLWVWNQAGLVNNLNDGMAWGLFPLLFVAAGLGLREIGWLAALYPAVWGIGQLFTGPASDRTGRKPFVVGGMLVQAGGIGVIGLSGGFGGFAVGSVLLGLGTAMVYPTLLAAISDATHPAERPRAIGTYRLWRDSGYAVGAVLAGIVADAFGLHAAAFAVALLTLASGLVVALRSDAVLLPLAPEGRAAHAEGLGGATHASVGVLEGAADAGGLVGGVGPATSLTELRR